MCGLVAYVGNAPALPRLRKMLTSLEYRGYDSWGVALQDGHGKFTVHKKVGAVSKGDWPTDFGWTIGIAHTRWATHGTVSVRNAHPITIKRKGAGHTVQFVHNGVVEDYVGVKEMLSRSLGYQFETETDTEVLAALYHYELMRNSRGLAAGEVVRTLKGEYAFIALDNRTGGDNWGLTLYSRGCPLILARMDDGWYVASEPRALATLGITSAYRLERGSAFFVNADYKSAALELIDKKVESISISGDQQTGTMLEEILSQPKTISLPTYSFIKEDKLPPYGDAERVSLFGCGSSYHAGLIGKYYFEQISGLPATCTHSTELADSTIFDVDETLFIGLTQSGETKDTLTALQRVYEHEPAIPVVCITEKQTSSAAQYCDSIIKIPCGHENAVASTKTFTHTVAALLKFAEQLGRQPQRKDIDKAIQDTIGVESAIFNLAERTKPYEHALILGRGILYPVALEMALKLKEVAYLHAEAMQASEMKHGPLALVDDRTVSIVFATSTDDKLNKILTNISEIRARSGKVIAFTDQGAAEVVKGYADEVLVLPNSEFFLQPFVFVVAAQLFAYHLSVLKGINPDRPRSLAKTITVE